MSGFTVNTCRLFAPYPLFKENAFFFSSPGEIVFKKKPAELYVKVQHPSGSFNETLWKRTNQLGDVWIKAQSKISSRPYSYSIAFEAVTGTGNTYFPTSFGAYFKPLQY